jgi:hypothetical protein
MALDMDDPFTKSFHVSFVTGAGLVHAVKALVAVAQLNAPALRHGRGYQARLHDKYYDGAKRRIMEKNTSQIGWLDLTLF